MNKTSKLLLGLAVLALGACSDDEPVKNGNDGGTPAQGDVAYLKVKIISGDAASRASGTNPDGLAYVDGVGDENTVDNAYFYFYDNAGNFVLESNSWTGEKEDDNDRNIEIIGNNTVILTGLTGKNYPNWVVTLLNKPEGFVAPTTLDGWKSKTLDKSIYVVGQGEDAQLRFVMTTSSYFGDDNKVNGSNSWNYFATRLDEKNFLQELPTKEEFTDENRVQIYVERLAARVGVQSNLSNASASKYYTENGKSYRLFRLDVSVAGDENNELGGATTGTAATKVYIALTGWEIGTIARYTNVVKVFGDDWTDQTTFGSWAATSWNHADYHRSYWGQSYTYGHSGDALALRLDAEHDYNNLNQLITLNTNPKVNGTIAYCNENTNKYENIVVDGVVSPKCATSVLIRAVVCDENAQPLSLVKYLGVNWTKEAFLNKVLDKTKPNAYTRTLEKTVMVGGVEREIYSYHQITAENLVVSSDGGNGQVKAVLATKILKTDEEGNTLDPAVPENWEPQVYYALGEKKTETDDDGSTITYYEATPADPAVVNANLAGATTGPSNVAYAATEGATYYAIPLEHLNPAAGKNEEGSYGVVRNHTYQLRISKIKSLGEFVFAPNDYWENGEHKDPEPIIPEDPKDPTYYVESAVNILSWKIVSQSVEL